MDSLRAQFIQIRLATSADIAPLMALARQTFVAAYGQDMEPMALETHLEGRLAQTHIAAMIAEDQVLLALAGRSAIGYAQIGPVCSDGWVSPHHFSVNPAAAELKRLYVLAELQNRGIGAQLLKAAMQARAVDAEIYVNVWHSNTAARRFYQRHGFVATNITKPYLEVAGGSAGHDLILVRRADWR